MYISSKIVYTHNSYFLRDITHTAFLSDSWTLDRIPWTLDNYVSNTVWNFIRKILEVQNYFKQHFNVNYSQVLV